MNVTRLITGRFERSLPALVAVFLLTGCAGDYVARTRGVREAYQTQQYDRALSELGEQQKDGKHGLDRLLYLMDEGMLLHAAGKYEDSIRKLAEADRLSAELDAVSVSEEARTLIGNERERAYRGEDFEKLMISVLQGLNYARLGKDDDALVEVRRVNERLRKMVQDEKKPYQQLAIARYLSGVLWEDQHEEDSAIIDYEAAFKLQPNLGPLADAMMRLAKRTGRDTLYENLQQRFPTTKPGPPLTKQDAQIVVVVESGLSPEKVNVSRNYDGSEGAQLIAIPVFRERSYPVIAHVAIGADAQDAVTVTSVDDVAKLHLDHRVGGLVARQLAGVAVRAGLATGVGMATRSEGLGLLTFFLLSLGNQPDLRSWMSLPAEFQVARFTVAPGEHRVEVTHRGQTTVHTVQAAPGRVGLLVLRRY